jgi:hypothetical protein
MQIGGGGREWFGRRCTQCRFIDACAHEVESGQVVEVRQEAATLAGSVGDMLQATLGDRVLQLLHFGLQLLALRQDLPNVQTMDSMVRKLIELACTMLLSRACAEDSSFKSCRSDVAAPSADAAAAAAISSRSISTSCALLSMLAAQRPRASCTGV